jgi:beta-N-acetylhexosaminidase
MALKDSFRRVRGPRRRRIVLRQLLAVLVVAVVVGGAIALIRGHAGRGGATAVRLPAATAGGDQPASHVSFLERLIPPPQERVSDPSAPRSIADLVRRLPLDRAVAQLFLLGFSGSDSTSPIFDQLGRLDIGGLVLDSRNYQTPQQLAGLTGQLSAAARAAKHLPPWILAEQDGGDYSQFPDLPPTHPPADFHGAADAAAALTSGATTLKGLGFNGLLDPDLDVSDRSGPLGAQAFSDNPQAVASYARDTVAACRKLRLFCAAKHFPGVGGADTATDEGPAQVGFSLPQLMERDVVPFAAAIKAGIPGIVVGEALYAPDEFVTPATLSSNIVGGLLRKRLRFGGLALTDDLSDPGVTTFSQVPDAAVAAIKAGADMVYISGAASDQESAYTAVLNGVRSGQIPEKRVREALLRVLLTKQVYGLLR